MWKILSILSVIGFVQCIDDSVFFPDFERNGPDRVGRIVGGVDAYIEDVPYQVSMRRLFVNETVTSWGHTCGGIIISTNAILTAAHCIYGRETTKFQIRAGSDLRSQGGQIINVTHFVMHHDYQHSGYYNDIAILMLQSRLQFSSKVWSIPLPARGFRIPDGAAMLVSGWGTLEFRGSSPERLQKVYVPYVNNEICAKSYSSIRPHKLCAGIEGKDSCQGDSGGPIIYKGALAGIVSSGNGCAFDGYPGIYTRVSEFLDWIGLNMFS